MGHEESMRIITVNVGRQELNFMETYLQSDDCPIPSRSELMRIALRAWIDREIERMRIMKQYNETCQTPVDLPVVTNTNQMISLSDGTVYKLKERV